MGEIYSSKSSPQRWSPLDDSEAELENLTKKVKSIPKGKHKFHLPKSNASFVFALAALTFLIVSIAAIIFSEYQKNKMHSVIVSYEDCVNAKDSETMESFPGTCITKDGRVFTTETDLEQSVNAVSNDTNLE